MSQEDFVIDNANGATVRTDINNNLAALATLSSGDIAPTTTLAYMLWADTTANELKQRNTANNGWISLGKLGQPLDHPGKQTVWIPAAALTPKSGAAAAAADAVLATNGATLPVLDFDAATLEAAHFALAMPKSWDEGTITAQFLWTAASGTGTVRWAVRALALSDDDPTNPAFGTAVTADDALTLADDLMVSPETGVVTIAGTPAEGDLVILEIYRDAADAADTFSGDARLIGVRLKYTTNAGNDD